MVTVDVNCLWNLCFKLVIYVLVKQQVLRWVVCVWQNCLIKQIDDFMQYKQQGAVTHHFCFLLFRAVNCTQIIYAFYVLCICGCNGYLQLHYRLRCLNPFVYVTAVFFFLQHPDITLLQLAFSEKHLPATISVDVIICCTLSSKLHFDVLRRLIVLGVLTQHSLYVSF